MSNQTNDESHRPWGYYEILSDDTDHKVKRITVYPGKRLSLQLHKKRSEHWFIVKGRGLVTINKQDIRLSEGESVDINRNDAHRIKNISCENLVFIEVQTGDYFGEDDIQRIEDDFGRV